MDGLKARIAESVDRLGDELTALSGRIHAHPELAFEERRACGWIAEFLAKCGFRVETGVGGTNGMGFTSLIMCTSNLPDKVAIAVDTQADDGNPATGQVRGQLQAAPTPATLAATNVSTYVESGTNQYLLCKNL